MSIGLNYVLEPLRQQYMLSELVETGVKVSIEWENGWRVIIDGDGPSEPFFVFGDAVEFVRETACRKFPNSAFAEKWRRKDICHSEI